VISKYSPAPADHQRGLLPFVDHSFYTTVNFVRTIEALLGVPPMNANDARAAVMAPLFSGAGNQPPFRADFRNRDNGRIYQMNEKPWPEGAHLDFSRADAVDTALLNRFLWEDRMPGRAMPKREHNVFAAADGGGGARQRDPD